MENKIYTLETYDEAIAFITANEEYTIEDIGNGNYQIVEIPKPTVEEKAKNLRQSRNQILDETDKYVAVADYPISEETQNKYLRYRQYLRDLPEDKNFPNIEILSFEKWCNINL